VSNGAVTSRRLREESDAVA
ncbi:hypothetical protein Tco_1297698, partial [Tanacetum coccineum]